MTKRIIAVALSVLLSLSCMTALHFSAAETDSPVGSQYAQNSVQGSAVLHCFNWSYNNIKSNLADIAAAGYTAVQTSPVQKPKDYNSSWTDVSGQWWKLYQPLGLSVSDGNTWLGTKAELKALCDEADSYGIKVIVDIVANHLANNGSDGGTYSNLNTGVDSDLKNSSYFHSDSNYINDDSRYNITQRHMNMPDLNTGNSYVQSKVLSLLKECVDCGVDGFRFDAAKHIELPTDDGCASSFWPTVINGVKSYTDNELYFYGEILGGAGTDIGNYTSYMSVTDNYTGDLSLYRADRSNAAGLADSNYYKGAGASKSVLWVESHDTYMGSSGSGGYGNTSGVSDASVIRAWAITGSRAGSTSLFFARPNGTMGAASSDTTWKSTAVAEINKFKNYFEGTSEYLAYNSDYNAAYNERGTQGVVISKLNGGGSVSLTANRMSSGTYTDRITGNTFTVSNGKISGTVGSTGVAVVYNSDEEIETTAPAEADYYLFGWINGANYACEDDYANTGIYKFTDGYLSATFNEDSYVAVKKGDNSGWYMTSGWPGTSATSATLYNTSTLSNANKLYVPGNKTVYFTLTENGNDTLSLSYSTTPPQVSYLTGDVDSDGEICIIDATWIQYQLAGFKKFGKMEKEAADCDGDGELSVTDVTALQYYLNEDEDSGNTGKEASVNKYFTLTFTNSQSWDGSIYCYYWADNNTSMIKWKGAEMLNTGTNSYSQNLYSITLPYTVEYVIFNNGTYQTENIAVSGTDARYYAKSTLDSDNHYAVGTW